MGKYVKYKGERCYIGGTNTDNLSKGKIYKVRREEPFVGKYYLDNTGCCFESFESFYSFLFDEVTPIKAISNVIPEEYKTLQCTAVNWVDGTPSFKEVNDPFGGTVNQIGENIYEVITAGNVYHVFVI